MAIKTLVKKNLKAKAEENTTTSVKKGKEDPVVIKAGKPLDHAVKQQPISSQENTFQQTVGMSKGLTKNMENYESFRVDCWLTDKVQPDESVQEALTRLSEVIDAQLQFEVDAILGE